MGRFILSIISLDSVVPLVYGLMAYYRLGRELRFLVGYIAISLVYTIVAITSLYMGHRTLWMSNMFLPIFICFTIQLMALWEPSAGRAQKIRWLIPLFLVVWVAEMWSAGPDEFSSISRPLGYCIVIGLAAYSLYRDNIRYEVSLLAQPVFWVCSGLLIAYAGQFSLALLTKTIYKISPTLLLFASYYIKPAFSVVETTFYLIGFVCQSRQFS